MSRSSDHPPSHALPELQDDDEDAGDDPSSPLYTSSAEADVDEDMAEVSQHVPPVQPNATEHRPVSSKHRHIRYGSDDSYSTISRRQRLMTRHLRLHDPATGLVVTGVNGCLDFKGAISGHKGRLKIDAGASHCFISAAFVKRIGLAVTPCVRSVALADGMSVRVIGVCTARIQLGTFADVVSFNVIQLSDEYDVLLGEQWLKRRQVLLDFERGTLTIKRPKGSLIVQGTSSEQVISPNLGGGESQLNDNFVLSALQLKRAVRKKAELFLAVVSKDDAGSVTIANPTRQTSCVVPNKQLQALLGKYKNLFEEMPAAEARPGLPDMTINLEPGAKPPVGVIYRLSHPEYLLCQQMIKEGLEKRLLEPSSSPYGAPVLFVRKPRSTALRMCCDYRALNKLTVKDRYPLPRIEDLLDRLRGAKVFSSLDLQSGYNQLLIAPEDRPKTQIITPFGSYSWRVVPFGLTNAPAFFMRTMNQIFSDLIGKCVFVYLDDILVFSATPEEHMQHLEAVLNRLQQHKLYCRLHKCHFGLPNVEYLGHIVGENGIRVDPRKVKIVQDWPAPKTQSELRGVDLLKEKLTHAPVLAMPDFEKPFEIVADASNTAVGAILLQDGKPIAFESRKLTPAEVAYDTMEHRDTRFTSQLWQHLQQQLGTTHKLSTAFHPQTDGQTERVNRVLEEYLRSFVNSTQSDWDDWLPLAEFAYNNSFHEAVGTTPFHLNYGKAPRLPSTPTGPARFPAADALVTHISDIVARAKKRLQAAADRVKHYADAHRADHSFTVGQQVLLSTKFLTLKLPGENKLLPKYVGPFTIQQAIGAVSYKLDLPACMKCHPVFHASLLKPYHKDGRYQPPPLPFEIDEEEGLWYEVDAVLQHRLLKRGRRHVLQYLVSFKGYDAAHNQWCDAAGVTQAAIDDYHQRTSTVPPSVPVSAPQTGTVTHVTPDPTPVAPSVSRSGRKYKPKVRFQS
eukprot:gene4792-biopygen6544